MDEKRELSNLEMRARQVACVGGVCAAVATGALSVSMVALSPFMFKNEHDYRLTFLISGVISTGIEIAAAQYLSERASYYGEELRRRKFEP